MILKQSKKLKKAICFDDCFYDLLSKKIGKIETGQFIKYSETMGNCYFFALILARAMPCCELKLGVLHSLDRNIRDCYYEEFEHSWVEKGDFVYDTTARMIFNKEFYYRQFNVEILKTYSSSELKNVDVFCDLGINAIKNRTELSASLFMCEEIKSISKKNFEDKISMIIDKTTQKSIMNSYENFYSKNKE